MTKKRIAVTIIIVLLTLFSCPVYGVNSFDLRDYINIRIENQKDTKACWAIAMSTVFETTLANRNRINVQISPRHMDYTTSQSFRNNVQNEFGYSRKVDTGGIPEFGLSYLTNGSGPMLEKLMPFSEIYDDIDISEIGGKTFEYYVKDWIKFPSIIKKGSNTYVDDNGEQYTIAKIIEIRNQIKNHIMQNGALYAGINAFDGFHEYYNYDTFAYNCNDYTKTTDHAVVIIGWDDNYSKYNFKENCIPNNDGAYIVQNSWGDSGILNNGVFYVSYEDVIIESAIYGISDISQKDYFKIYQYDKLGRNGYFEIDGMDVAYGACVYKRENIANEVLSHVGISAHMNMDCEIYINPVDNEFDRSKLIKISEGKLHPGYNMLNLDQDVKLTGESFAIVVKYKKSDKIFGISILSQYIGESLDNPYKDIISNRGESFVGTSLENLTDLYEKESNTNICIKAFTKQEGVDYQKLKGDVNNDGKITALDLSFLVMHIVGLRIIENTNLVDINGDGRVSALDLSILQEIIVNY